MSTYIYLQCQNHTPPLNADEESGQHLYDLPRIRAELAERKQLIEELARGDLWQTTISDTDASISRYFRSRSATFLDTHRECAIRIVTEYGDDVTEEETAS